MGRRRSNHNGVLDLLHKRLCINERHSLRTSHQLLWGFILTTLWSSTILRNTRGCPCSVRCFNSLLSLRIWKPLSAYLVIPPTKETHRVPPASNSRFVHHIYSVDAHLCVSICYFCVNSETNVMKETVLSQTTFVIQAIVQWDSSWINATIWSSYAYYAALKHIRWRDL